MAVPDRIMYPESYYTLESWYTGKGIKGCWVELGFVQSVILLSPPPLTKSSTAHLPQNTGSDVTARTHAPRRRQLCASSTQVQWVTLSRTDGHHAALSLAGGPRARLPLVAADPVPTNDATVTKLFKKCSMESAAIACCLI